MNIAVFLLLVLVLTGCSTEVRIPEKQYIPVKCKIDKVLPPISKAKDASDFKGIYENVVNIQIYTENLESDLDFCTGGQ